MKTQQKPKNKNTILPKPRKSLKSETAEKCIAGVIALQPKFYCIKLEDDSTKLAAKGIPRFQQETLSYEKYEEAYNTQRRGENFTVTSIRSDRAELVTRRETRQGLFFMDLKRYYHNIDDSVAYGHPSIPKPTQSSLPPSPAPRPAKRAREGELVLETNKRHRKLLKANLDKRQV